MRFLQNTLSFSLFFSVFSYCFFVVRANATNILFRVGVFSFFSSIWLRFFSREMLMLCILYLHRFLFRQFSSSSSSCDFYSVFFISFSTLYLPLLRFLFILFPFFVGSLNHWCFFDIMFFHFFVFLRSLSLENLPFCCSTMLSLPVVYLIFFFTMHFTIYTQMRKHWGKM